MTSHLTRFVVFTTILSLNALHLSAGVSGAHGDPIEERVDLFENSSSKTSLDTILFSAPSSVNLVDYDELWADYLPESGGEPSAVMLDLSFQVKEPYTRRSARLTADALAPRYSAAGEAAGEDMPWVPKDKWFQLGRLLGSSPDGRWHYALLADTLVSQARFNIPLSGVDAVAIYLQPGAEILGVNLRVASSPGRTPGKLVESAQIPSQDMNGPTGRFRRIDIRHLLAEQFPRAKAPVLKEVAVFLRSETPADLKEKPVRRILLERFAYPLSLPIKKGRVLKMQARVEVLRGKQRRFVARLEGAKAKGDAILTGGRLQFFYPPEVRGAGTRVSRISLVLKSVPVQQSVISSVIASPRPASKVPFPLRLKRAIIAVLPVAAGLLFIFSMAWGARKFRAGIQRRFPGLARGLFREPHRVYFAIAGLFLLLTALLTLTGRGHAADPAAAMTYMALAAGVVSLSKGLFSGD